MKKIITLFLFAMFVMQTNLVYAIEAVKVPRGTEVPVYFSSNVNSDRLYSGDIVSVKVAEEFFKDPNKAVVVYGQNFPDGLSGGPLAVSLGGPLILSKEGSEAAAAVYAEKAGITSGMVLGGPTLIPDPIVKKVFRMGEGVHIVVR